MTSNRATNPINICISSKLSSRKSMKLKAGNGYSLKDKNKAKTDKTGHGNGKSVKSQIRSQRRVHLNWVNPEFHNEVSSGWRIDELLDLRFKVSLLSSLTNALNMLDQNDNYCLNIIAKLPYCREVPIYHEPLIAIVVSASVVVRSIGTDKSHLSLVTSLNQGAFIMESVRSYGMKIGGSSGGYQ
ncbi:hypothetical protein Tco_0336386 [Tanacetum coccineum]